jgi:PAS domain S-box-containing protein
LNHQPILIADSEPRVVQLIQATLRRTGVATVAVASCDEILDIAARATPRLLILGYRVPPLGAIGLVDALRSRGLDVPFVCLLGEGEEQLAVELIHQGASDYVIKDATFFEIMPHVVRRALVELDRNERLIRVEQTLLTTERKFQALLTAAPDAVVISDSDGRIVVVNAEAERLFGYESAEMLGQGIGLLIPERQGRGNVSARAPQPGAGGPRRVLTGVSKGGRSFPIEVSLGPVEVDDGVLLFNAIRDVSERQRLEQELAEAQKMEAVGRLAGGIAHDFNNILAAILSFASLAREDIPDDHFVAADLDGIIGSARRGAALVSQLLAFSRRQVTRPELCSLNDVIRNLQGMLQRVVGEHIRFRLQLGADLQPVRVDQGQMDQVLMNLVVNARDAMPNGGALTITTGRGESGGSGGDSGSVLPPGQYVTLAVADTGKGIAPEHLQKVFDPFFTTKQSSGGTGLGLSTVYGILQQNQGHIEVRSEVGKGTCFVISLPAQQGEPQRARGTVPPSERAPGGGGTVLVVEDEPEVRSLLVRTLVRYGYEVLEADGAAQALYVSERHPKKIDLLLSDVVMPTMSGPELAQRICRTRPETEVLFMTGYVGDTLLHDGLGLAQAPLIQKPFGPKELGLAVRDALGGPASRRTR